MFDSLVLMETLWVHWHWQRLEEVKSREESRKSCQAHFSQTFTSLIYLQMAGTDWRWWSTQSVTGLYSNPGLMFWETRVLRNTDYRLVWPLSRLFWQWPTVFMTSSCITALFQVDTAMDTASSSFTGQSCHHANRHNKVEKMSKLGLCVLNLVRQIWVLSFECLQDILTIDNNQ